MCPLQIESGQGDLGTLANVVTSLANLSDSLNDNLNNGDTSDSQQEEQTASEITRSVSSTWRRKTGLLINHCLLSISVILSCVFFFSICIVSHDTPFLWSR